MLRSYPWVLVLALCMLGVLRGAEAVNEASEGDFELDAFSGEPLAPPMPKCELECSGHGSCDLETLECSCWDSWAGRGCEYPILPLTLNKLVNGTLSKNASSPAIVWNYWKADLNSGNVLEVIVVPNACVLNLYGAYKVAPDVGHYMVAVHAPVKEVMRYEDPNMGAWLFGVAAATNCSYSLNVTTHWKCPNDCSAHGRCNVLTGVCECQTNYTMLADCSLAVFPATGAPISGSLIPNAWSYYMYDSIGNDLLVTITIAPNTSPEALTPPGAYLRSSMMPALYEYTQACNVIEYGTSCTLHVTRPKAGNWNLGLWGISPVNYTVQFTGAVLCPNGCSGYGTCDANGVCVCPTYYRQPDCAEYIHPLTPNVPPEASILITMNQFQYFTYSSTGASNDMSITVTQSAIVPQIRLAILASCGTIPTPFDYDHGVFCDGIDTLCGLTLTRAPPCAWTIAVWAKNASLSSDFNGMASDISYDVSSSKILSSSKMSSEVLSSSKMSSSSEALSTMSSSKMSSSSEALSTMSSSKMSSSSEALSTISSSKISSKMPSSKKSSRHPSSNFASSSLRALDTFESSSAFQFSSMNEDLPQVEYTIELDTSLQCPNDCNDHGICQSPGVCVCELDYSSSADCSIFQHIMLNNSAVPGRIEPGQWRYYSIFADMDNYLSFTIQNVQGGVIEAYLGKHFFPNALEYTKAISPGNQSMYQLSTAASSSPINGTYTLGIFGRDRIGTSFSVIAVADRACPAGCSMNGVCTASGTCICNPGYVKSDCSALSVTLPANLEIQGMVRFDTWSFYNMTILGDDALELFLQENDNLIYGLVWLFLAKDRLPTIEDHDFSNQSDSIMHTIFVPSGETRGAWIIGVTGSPRATGSSYGRTAKYNLFATSGCGTYASCDTCVLDPNCGWCRNQPFDPAAGRCVPGNDMQSLNQTCLFYQYSSCNLKSDMSYALMKGLVIGVSVGLFILIAAIVTAFLLYRYYKQWEKIGLRPVNILPDEDRPNPLLQHHPSSAPVSRSPSSLDNTNYSGPLIQHTDLLDKDDSSASFNHGAFGPSTTSPHPTPSSSVSSGLTSPNLNPNHVKLDLPPRLSHQHYGSMEPSEEDQRFTGEGIYHSFSPADPYTDSEMDEGEYSSDSEAD